MGYNDVTFGGLKSELAQRLGDSSKTFWVDTELGVYLTSALRTWNAVSRWFRTRVQFATSNNTQFYNLPSVARDGNGALVLGYDVTDANLIQLMKYMLNEPSPGDTTTFTEQFSLAALTDALNAARDKFRLDTAVVISQPTPQIVTSGDGIVVLTDDSIIDIRRATWTDVSTGAVTLLQKQDPVQLQAFSPAWSVTSGTPQTFTLVTSPSLSLQLSPPPQNNGTLTLLTISAGLTLTGAGVIVGVPDDLTPYVAFEAMAELLSKDGPAMDIPRAAYLRQRYAEGVQLGRAAVSIMQAYINGVPSFTESLFDNDYFKPATATGAPSSVAMAGLNLLSLSPTPDGVYSITADIVQDAPVYGDGDFIQVGPEYIDTVLGYAQHLASFKLAGTEFKETLSLYEEFMQSAFDFNSRLSASGIDFDVLMGRERKESTQRRLRDEDTSLVRQYPWEERAAR